MTIAEQLRREGKQKGLEEGRKKGLREGLEKGLQEGRREALRNLLHAKFKRVDELYATLLESADEATLQRYGERLLTAASMKRSSRTETGHLSGFGRFMCSSAAAASMS